MRTEANSRIMDSNGCVKPGGETMKAEAKSKIMDAKVVDAKRVDARVIDAKLVDAKLVDAKLVDAMVADAKVLDPKALDPKVIDPSICAKQVVETVPEIMRLIRTGVRRRGALSVPQVRVLSHLTRQPGASVSEIAYLLDVTIPSASALVERLVRKNMVRRQDDPNERRRVLLTLTPAGVEAYEQSKAIAQEFVANLLNVESPEKLNAINEGLLFLADAARAFNAGRK